AASPKARRLATERRVDIQALRGSGPGGAILAADVFAGTPSAATQAEAPGVGTVWRIMAERMTASWTTAPHFYLVREVTVSRLVSWRDRARKQTGARITYTDLLVKLVAAALSQHPGVNASWTDRVIALNGQPAVQPTMMLTLSCDHRALDGARGAQFLGALADLIEEPLALLV